METMSNLDADRGVRWCTVATDQGSKWLYRTECQPDPCQTPTFLPPRWPGCQCLRESDFKFSTPPQIRVQSGAGMLIGR